MLLRKLQVERCFPIGLEQSSELALQLLRLEFVLQEKVGGIPRMTRRKEDDDVLQKIETSFEPDSRVGFDAENGTKNEAQRKQNLERSNI